MANQNNQSLITSSTRAAEEEALTLIDSELDNVEANLAALGPQIGALISAFQAETSQLVFGHIQAEFLSVHGPSFVDDAFWDSAKEMTANLILQINTSQGKLSVPASMSPDSPLGRIQPTNYAYFVLVDIPRKNIDSRFNVRLSTGQLVKYVGRISYTRRTGQVVTTDALAGAFPVGGLQPNDHTRVVEIPDYSGPATLTLLLRPPAQLIRDPVTHETTEIPSADEIVYGPTAINISPKSFGAFGFTVTTRPVQRVF